MLDFWQCTPYNCGSTSMWQLSYTYDSAGNVSTWTHPAGFTLTNTYNAAMQVIETASSWNDSTHPGTLATLTYAHSGALGTLVNGCAGSGCTQAQQTYDYNNRLQPVRIQLGTSSNSAANYCLVYNYYAGVANPATCTNSPATASSGNNGNVMGYWYQDKANSTYSHTASYAYDSLNRLATAVATGSSTYNLTFSSDRYGNLTCVTNGQTNGPCPNLSFSASTNQITSSGYTYDAAGNVTANPAMYPTQDYQWDAEGRVSAVMSGGSAMWSFTYNALGQRASWVPWGGTAHNAYYDPQGTLLGMAGLYSMLRFPGSSVVYIGSETWFSHPNNLGSDTMVTSHAGAVLGDLVFYPWGDVWLQQGSTGYNFASLPYYDVPTNTSITTARFYPNNIGHWLSPDPLGGEITNPQSLNRYAYAGNNPTTLVDPKGLYRFLPCSSDGGICNWGFPGLSSGGGGGAGGGAGGGCTMDGVYGPCPTLGWNAYGNATGTDTTPRYNPETDQWSFFGCYADGSCGFVPSSLSGNSPLEILNQLAIVQQGQTAVKNGTLIDWQSLKGNAAKAYDLLTEAGVPATGIQIYQTDDGKISIVLSPGAFNTLQNVLQPGYRATFLHPPYSEGGRLTVESGPFGTLHVVWVPGNIAAYFGGDGSGYAQAHVDITNPANNLWRHLCETFGLCH